MSLTRDAFLKPAEIPMEEVPIPELGGSVWIKGMTAKGRAEFERQFQTGSGKQHKGRIGEVRERLMVACCCDKDGNQIFQTDDVAAIGLQRVDIIERCVNVAMRLCGMSETDVESLAKN